jgi:glutaredoxin 3
MPRAEIALARQWRCRQGLLGLAVVSPHTAFHCHCAIMQSVKMYTTQVCPFCIRAKMLLKQRGVDAIEEIRIDLDPAQRDEMMAITGRRTVPQIFIGATHVGGCDELIDLDRRGELLPLLGAA